MVFFLWPRVLVSDNTPWNSTLPPYDMSNQFNYPASFSLPLRSLFAVVTLWFRVHQQPNSSHFSRPGTSKSDCIRGQTYRSEDVYFLFYLSIISGTNDLKSRTQISYWLLYTVFIPRYERYSINKVNFASGLDNGNNNLYSHFLWWFFSCPWRLNTWTSFVTATRETFFFTGKTMYSHFIGFHFDSGLLRQMLL